jgi:transmembrane sensor
MRANMDTKRAHEIDAAASDWLIRRESGAWSAVDEAGFVEWLNASTLNRVAFLRLELAWEDSASLKALGAGIAGDRPPPPGSWNLTPFFDPQPAGSSYDEPQTVLCEPMYPASPDASPEPEDASVRPAPVQAADRSGRLALRQRRFVLAIAATLVLAVGIGGYVALAPNGERYATPVGGLASVAMTDGSEVTLNTDSQIRIALTGTERHVELRHGEAFFQVSKDPNRPFVVLAGNKRVVAVGTQFSVRHEGDDVEIVVTEGKVRVEDEVAHPGSHADGSAEVLLTPGSVALAGEAGLLVQRKTLPEAEEQLSWRTGVLMFRNQSLLDVAAEFNRYNQRKIVIRDPAVASLKIEGNFRATNAEAFVRLVESAFPVRADAQRDKIVLTAK